MIIISASCKHTHHLQQTPEQIATVGADYKQQLHLIFGSYSQPLDLEHSTAYERNSPINLLNIANFRAFANQGVDVVDFDTDGSLLHVTKKDNPIISRCFAIALEGVPTIADHNRSVIVTSYSAELPAAYQDRSYQYCPDGSIVAANEESYQAFLAYWHYRGFGISLSLVTKFLDKNAVFKDSSLHDSSTRSLSKSASEVLELSKSRKITIPTTPRFSAAQLSAKLQEMPLLYRIGQGGSALEADIWKQLKEKMTTIGQLGKGAFAVVEEVIIDGRKYALRTEVASPRLSQEELSAWLNIKRAERITNFALGEFAAHSRDPLILVPHLSCITEDNTYVTLMPLIEGGTLVKHLPDPPKLREKAENSPTDEWSLQSSQQSETITTAADSTTASSLSANQAPEKLSSTSRETEDLSADSLKTASPSQEENLATSTHTLPTPSSEARAEKLQQMGQQLAKQLTLFHEGIPLDMTLGLGVREPRLHVFHRDIKPANVLVNSAGAPIIGDFGLSKVVITYKNSAGKREIKTLGFDAHGEVTFTDDLIVLDKESRNTFSIFEGTPSYMAPELTGKIPLTHEEIFALLRNADIEAYNRLLYEMKTGKSYLEELAALHGEKVPKPFGLFTFYEDLALATVPKRSLRTWEEADGMGIFR